MLKTIWRAIYFGPFEYPNSSLIRSLLYVAAPEHLPCFLADDESYVQDVSSECSDVQEISSDEIEELDPIAIDY